MTEITGIPIHCGTRRVGAASTRFDSLTILWDHDISEEFKNLAVTGFLIGIKLEPIYQAGFPKNRPGEESNEG